MDIKEPHGEWEQLWVEGLTPWDLGEATPIVVHLVESGSLPNGRALIPGCGTGYDVVEMASPDRYVVGLDISKTSVERSTKMFSSLPNANQFSFVEEDFFTWEPKKFNLIFDYGFFCAFEPKVRPLWAKRTDELLKPGGELITMIFPLDDRYGGPPPWPVSVSDYEKLLIPLGFEVISIVDNHLSPDLRKGTEKVGRWKKKKQSV